MHATWQNHYHPSMCDSATASPECLTKGDVAELRASDIRAQALCTPPRCRGMKGNQKPDRGFLMMSTNSTKPQCLALSSCAQCPRAIVNSVTSDFQNSPDLQDKLQVHLI